MKMEKIIAGYLPDLEDSEHMIRHHPDGLGWLKACPECAHRTSDPQRVGDRYQKKMMEFDGVAVFYCLHRRTEDGHDRICACYAATHRLAQVGPGAKSIFPTDDTHPSRLEP